METTVIAPIASVPAVSGHGRLAAFWAVCGALGAAAVLPYALALNPALAARIPMAMPVFVLVQFLQTFLMLALLGWIGLRLGQSVGLDSPLARAFVYRSPLPAISVRSLAFAAMSGILACALLFVLDKAFAPFMPSLAAPPTAGIALWKRALACFYGGITEELLTRLVLMTLVVWVLWKIAQQGKGKPSSTVFVAGIVIAAIVFGLGHLPATAQVWPLTPLVVARTVLLNAIGGVVFGWLYWRRGLEHAMFAHFCGDIVLHVIGGA